MSGEKGGPRREDDRVQIETVDNLRLTKGRVAEATDLLMRKGGRETAQEIVDQVIGTRIVTKKGSWGEDVKEKQSFIKVKQRVGGTEMLLARKLLPKNILQRLGYLEGQNRTKELNGKELQERGFYRHFVHLQVLRFLDIVNGDPRIGYFSIDTGFVVDESQKRKEVGIQMRAKGISAEGEKSEVKAKDRRLTKIVEVNNSSDPRFADNGGEENMAGETKDEVAGDDEEVDMESNETPVEESGRGEEEKSFEQILKEGKEDLEKLKSIPRPEVARERIEADQALLWENAKRNRDFLGKVIEEYAKNGKVEEMLDRADEVLKGMGIDYVKDPREALLKLAVEAVVSYLRENKGDEWMNKASFGADELMSEAAAIWKEENEGEEIEKQPWWKKTEYQAMIKTSAKDVRRAFLS